MFIQKLLIQKISSINLLAAVDPNSRKFSDHYYIVSPNIDGKQSSVETYCAACQKTNTS